MERRFAVSGLALCVLLAGCSSPAPAPDPAAAPAAAGAEVEEDEDGAKETPVALADLPAVVRRAAEAAVPGLEVRSSQKEEEDGRPVYEVSGVVAGTAVEVLVTPEGEVLVVERAIPVDSVPANVRKAATDRVPGLVIAMAEEIKAGGATQYEVKGKADGKRFELKLSESGEVLEIED